MHSKRQLDLLIILLSSCKSDKQFCDAVLAVLLLVTVNL